ncbi:hypothetical protein ACFV1L_30360 [Kitasatospora sp. NPDC059646]|uniref:hypothetical protein n=1 Tax=Kitasatospora sp. NPDC059646 TaxID=3346893 RepID=UPI00369BBDAB
MKRSLKKRVVQTVLAGALALCSVALSSGSAEASGGWTVRLNTSHNVGLYWAPWTNDKDGHADLHPGDVVEVFCWTTGEDIANQGNVWYFVRNEWYMGGTNWQSFDDYVYGAYVDNYALWHARATNGLRPC